MASDIQLDDLQTRLAPVLPKDYQFNIYHLSTPPTKCDPLFSPPPGERPDRTYCEKHFLAVSIDQAAPQQTTNESQAADSKRILVLGIEVLIFTTSRATTLFVSKADSTGYLHMLKLPAGTPSPIREICATFINFLADKRRRANVQHVVSLFARSQDQYLFPGSVKNSGKHILDDRGLVKWWCRVLDPVLGGTTRGYIVVPGLDTHETRAFMPRGPKASGSWIANHPLERISPYTKEFDWVPPRCLIPQYPDDPKSRFRDELDEEAAKTAQFRNTGGWKSVRTLDTFWELMAFRQECSSGRLTGFIWVVFDDHEQDKDSKNATSPNEGRPVESEASQDKQSINGRASTVPRKLVPSKRNGKSDQANTKISKSQKPKKKKKLKGVIVTRQPRVKTALRNYLLDKPATTAYYHWGESGRGERIVSDSDYKRIVELLLHLDFATFDKGAGSTRRWVSEVGMGSSWGYAVKGAREIPEAPAPNQGESNGQQVNNLTGLVKRKRTEDGPGGEANVLNTGLIRKKAKTEEATAPPEVNVLGQGLVRKKPKA